MDNPTALLDRKSDATRYLCTAARIDQTFRERVMSELLDEDLRAVAPSVGFDLSPVLRHCLAAHRQRRWRDIGVLLTGVAAFAVAPLWTVLTGVALAVGSAMRPSRPTRIGILGPVARMAGVAVVAVLLMFYVGGLDDDSGGSYDESAPGWLVGAPWLALLLGLAAYLVLVWDALVTRRVLVTDLRRGRFRPESGPAPEPETYEEGRLADLDQAQRGNVTVYGGYAPFVGHGTQLAGWSFALPIRPDTGPGLDAGAAAGEENLAEEAGGTPTADPDTGTGGRGGGTVAEGRAGGADAARFQVVELIDYVRDRLAAVAHGPAVAAAAGSAGVPLDRLDGAWLEDRIFVCGDGLTEDTRFLPDREEMPRHLLDDDEVRRIAGDPHGLVRHYLCAFVPSWGGEVVAGTFLHFSTDGQVLYLECARTVLEPLRREYHEVDRLTEELSPVQLVRVLAEAAGRLLPTALASPVYLVRDVVLLATRPGRRLRARDAAREDLGYNYGVRTSVRELGVDLSYHNYFQVLDAAKHLKVVERHVLAGILDFLDDHGVNTAEFRNRQMTILNQGVIQTGGLSVVSNQAVGAGATAQQRLASGKESRGGDKD